MTPTLKLDFEQTRGGDYVADAGRYRVRLVRDDSPSDPWTDQDGLAPYIRAGGRHRSIRETPDFVTGTRDLLKGWTRQQCKLFAAMFARAQDGTAASRYRDALESESGADTHSDDLARALFDAWCEELPGGDPREAYAAAFRVSGWPCLEHTSTGYSQGDYSELLFVWTPEAAATCGIPLDRQTRDLDSAARLYDCWAWGDVYGFVIETREGDHVDSCWGFYTQSPDSDDESGMLDAISESMPDDWQTDSDIGAAALYAVA